MKPLFLLVTLTASCWLGAQSKSEILLFHGDDRHVLEIIPYSKPPSVHLGDVLTALQIPFSDLSAPVIELSVNRRKLVLDKTKSVALYKNKSVPFPLRVKNGKVFVSVDHLTGVLSELLGRTMIYEKTSKSLHLPKKRDVHVALKMRRVQDGYHVVLTYSHPLAAPHIEKAGRNLIVKIKASPIIWEESGFETNNAVTAMELYENLPDESTEILFRIGADAARYSVDPYTPDNPRTVIKIVGQFDKETEAKPLVTEALASGIKRIMIDPGHGGKDQGAKGPTGLLEKEVTLELAKSLKAKLMAAGYDVKLTRKDDTLLSLKTRTGMANEFEADLLISVHVNAIRSQNATGSETYYLSLDASEAYNNPHYEEYDEDESGPMAMDDDLSLMLWDMAQTKHIEDSFRVARYVQQELNKLAGVRNRGVKQAPLKVLKGATMPAILIETAFISNKEEEAKLRSAVFKKNIVDAVFTAVTLYDEDVIKRSNGREIGGGDPRQ